MQIKGYNELDPNDVLQLHSTCFFWFFRPSQVRRLLNEDPRVRDMFGVYAVEDERVLGEVGTLTFPLETRSGTTDAGGIWGVATMPHSTRKGIARRLMEEAADRFREKGIRYSFLFTGRQLVAYDLYRKLDYQDLVPFRRGFKVCREAKEPALNGRRMDPESTHSELEGMTIDIVKPAGEANINGLFRINTEGLLGCVHRPDRFVEIRNLWEWKKIGFAALLGENGNQWGYILGTREGDVIGIDEVSVPNPGRIPDAVRLLEHHFDPEHIWFNWQSRMSNVEAFSSYGFDHVENSYGYLMVKDLEGDTDTDAIRAELGLDDDIFQMSSVDEF